MARFVVMSFSWHLLLSVIDLRLCIWACLAAVISFLLSAIGVFGGNDITSLGYYWRVQDDFALHLSRFFTVLAAHKPCIRDLLLLALA